MRRGLVNVTRVFKKLYYLHSHFSLLQLSTFDSFQMADSVYCVSSRNIPRLVVTCGHATHRRQKRRIFQLHFINLITSNKSTVFKFRNLWVGDVLPSTTFSSGIRFKLTTIQVKFLKPSSSPLPCSINVTINNRNHILWPLKQ
jgi:hypothetical protein